MIFARLVVAVVSVEDEWAVAAMVVASEAAMVDVSVAFRWRLWYVILGSKVTSPG